jgi:hypothetical protein
MLGIATVEVPVVLVRMKYLFVPPLVPVTTLLGSWRCILAILKYTTTTSSCYSGSYEHSFGYFQRLDRIGSNLLVIFTQEERSVLIGLDRLEDGIVRDRMSIFTINTRISCTQDLA